jgi:vanillate O-demethylase monooxygenase subunit
MGEPESAKPDDIPDLYWHDGPDWLATGEVLNVACNYMLLVDIQLDNTHATYVHPATLGSSAIQDTPPNVIRDGDRIHVGRWMLDVEPPPIWALAGGFTGNVDRWILANFSPPSLCAFDIGAAEAGSGAPDGDRSRGITMRTSHFVTPETETSCHYFWLFARNYGLDDAALSEKLHAGIAATFHEDVDIVEAQQRNMSARPDAVQIDVNADTPTIQTRRLMERLIAAEAVQGT